MKACLVDILYLFYDKSPSIFLLSFYCISFSLYILQIQNWWRNQFQYLAYQKNLFFSWIYGMRIASCLIKNMKLWVANYALEFNKQNARVAHSNCEFQIKCASWKIKLQKLKYNLKKNCKKEVLGLRTLTWFT